MILRAWFPAVSRSSYSIRPDSEASGFPIQWTKEAGDQSESGKRTMWYPQTQIPFSYSFIHFHLISSTFINFHPLLWPILTTCINGHSISSPFIPFNQLSSISSTVINFINFHLLVSTFIHLNPLLCNFHPLSGKFINFHQIPSTFIYLNSSLLSFLDFCPLSSTCINVHPFSSTLIHLHSLLSPFFNFYPFPSTFIHFNLLP